MSRKVIDLDAEKERRIEETWRDYCEARMRAEATMAVEDGIAAGKAWRRWLDLFMSPEQRRSLDSASVITPVRRIG